VVILALPVERGFGKTNPFTINLPIEIMCIVCIVKVLISNSEDACGVAISQHTLTAVPRKSDRSEYKRCH